MTTDGPESAALRRYREVVARLSAAGGLDARAQTQLALLRGRLGIAGDDEATLTAPAEISGDTAARLFIDATTVRHFEVGSRCLLRLRVHNDGELAWESGRIEARLVGEDALAPLAFGTVFPGEAHTADLWLVPRVGGYQELSGQIAWVDLAGDRRVCAFDAVKFRVGSGGDSPQVSIVNIDQSSARVVDNSRSQFGGDPSSEPGLVETADWRPIGVRLLPPEPIAPPPQRPPDPDAATSARVRPGQPVDFGVRAHHGRYRAHSVLAQGDLSTVYAGVAVPDEDGHPAPAVVLKLVDQRDDNDLMQSEVDVLERLYAAAGAQAKHLPQVRDRFRAPDGRLGTVLERIDGYTLFELRDRLPAGVPDRHLIWIMRRALSVLGRAHALGVLHGNVDPGHILVRPRDHNVWLIDWCHAIVEPARTGQTFRWLNDDYSPPEVAARKPPLPSSDLFSLGRTMIYMLGGDPRTGALPERVDPRIAQLLRFFVLESPRGRAQDAWRQYETLDRLREQIWGPHTFVPLEV